MDYTKLADLLFEDIKTTPDYYEGLYPARSLPEGAKVTRFAPSPTGFVHFGGLFPVLINLFLARQSNGVFYLRIEDTDLKREVKGAEADIIKVFSDFGIDFDESLVNPGEYGPYRQSDRKLIYQTYAKELVAKGQAYPCFCTPEELNEIRQKQEDKKVIPGYYGEYTRCKDLSYAQIEDKISMGLPYVLRLNSKGSQDNKIKFTDLVKGTVEITENFIDHVLLKSDGLPTYHMAHAVDDHLMKTTHVVRGEEWLSSLPYHIELFRAFGFKLPKYLHIAQLMRLEGNARKKLSKRDKGAGLASYISDGYPVQAVLEYVMTLLNSNFEDWRVANPDKDFYDFPFSTKKLSSSGSLFDLQKLADISKNVVSVLTAEQVYNNVLDWSRSNDPSFFDKLKSNRDYTIYILSIGRGGKKPRKDFGLWSEVKPFISFFFDEYFEVLEDLPEGFAKADVKDLLADYAAEYDYFDDKDAWFDRIKTLAEKQGFCPNVKEYRQDPSSWKGHVGDYTTFIRLAVTGKQNSPDLYTVMQILGEEKSKARITAYAESL